MRWKFDDDVGTIGGSREDGLSIFGPFDGSRNPIDTLSGNPAIDDVSKFQARRGRFDKDPGDGTADGAKTDNGDPKRAR